MLIASVSWVAPASGADTPPPAIYVDTMLDGSVRLEGKRYSEPAPLRAKLAEISQRVPTPALQLRYGEAGPCGGDPFAAATQLLVKAGFLPPPGVTVGSRLCVGPDFGSDQLRLVPVAPMVLPPN